MRNLSMIRGVALGGACAAAVAAWPCAALAEDDQAGCRDGALARVSGYYINECEVSARDHFVFAEGTPAQKDVTGTKTRIAYAIKTGAQETSPTGVLNDYGDRLKAAGWTVAGTGEQRWLAAYQGSGGQWIEVETNGPGNYQVTYVAGAQPALAASTAAAAPRAAASTGQGATAIAHDSSLGHLQALPGQSATVGCDLDVIYTAITNTSKYDFPPGTTYTITWSMSSQISSMGVTSTGATQTLPAGIAHGAKVRVNDQWQQLHTCTAFIKAPSS